MGRYFATQGIREVAGNLSFPFIILFGPSGQAVQTPYPKGYIDDNRGFGPASRNVRKPQSSSTDGSNVFGAGFPLQMQAWENTFNHTSLAWIRNAINTCFIDSISTQDTVIPLVWQPYGQPPSGGHKLEGIVGGQSSGAHKPKINSFTAPGDSTQFEPEANAAYWQRVMSDGFEYSQFVHHIPGGFRELHAYKRTADGGVMCIKVMTSAEGFKKAYYEGQIDDGLKFTAEDNVPADAQVGSGWVSSKGGHRGEIALTTGSPIHVISLNNQSSNNYAGIQYGGDAGGTAISAVPNDIQYHKGTTYIATQFGVLATHPNIKGGGISDNRARDDLAGLIASKTDPDMSTYTSRKSNDFDGGPQGRSFAKHKGELYMLGNTGRVWRITPASIILIANIGTQLNTFAANNIFGGFLSKGPTFPSTYPGSSNYRAKLISFNGQLHAFLNFTSNERVAKSDNSDNPSFGRGVAWFTSENGSSWSDRSPLLPMSGIIPDETGLGNWKTKIAPYLFSATPGKTFPSGVLGDGNNTLDYPDYAGMAGPSGFRQTGNLSTWASGDGAINGFGIDVVTSGVILDSPGTAFGALKVPLTFGRITRALYPTEVVLPAGYGFIAGGSGRLVPIPRASGAGGIYSPSGIGASGLDYTGCRNYHISAVVDDINSTMKVIFSEDFEDGGLTYYELNKASGWRQVNQLPDSKQTNGLVSIDLYDPEIIIASGTNFRPNPRVDEVSQNVHVDFTLHDWPFYRTVDVVAEYSIDEGLEWREIATMTDLSTGTLQSDPSGLVGSAHTFTWNYTTGPRPLSKSSFYPNFQIRMRAVDDSFTL